MKKIYKVIVRILKAIDRSSGYKLGSFIRKKTNVNTIDFWNETWTKKEGDEDFRYNYFLEFLPKARVFSLLDIGCASGEGCVLIKKHFPKAEITGIDFSSVAINMANEKKSDINFIRMDILKESPTQKYDYITIIHTLEHFNDPFQVVNKCLNFVNEALIIEAPYTEKFDVPYLYRKGQHRYLFNEKTFEKYKCKVLKITEYIESAKYRYIVYQIEP
ncbi:MAG: class I SAM-dependent methyltransferase [Candidatus Omnitrophota bacterium]